VVIHDGTQLLPTPFLDIAPIVSCCGERGLLSVAFHPQYAVNGRFYVNYTNTSGHTVIARYSVSGNPNLADPASGSVLLTVMQPFSNHNGGQLQFGPDGYLYIGMGDGGSAGDPNDLAQDPATLLGKMLRIDVDGGVPYAVPATNPFVGVPGVLDEIWALGLRNPWRFSFDRATGDLFIADVGQNSWEEVDFQPTGSPGGENYGWRRMEGSDCFNPPSGCNDGSLVLPIAEYSHSLGCSITGGYRYRGPQFPHLRGFYLYGDYCSGRIWGTSERAGSWTTAELVDTTFTISAFGEDEAGELYVTHYSSSSGAIHRITSPPPCDDGLDNDGDGLVDAGNDPGCRNASSTLEDPRCDDDDDNDGDGRIDWDGDPEGNGDGPGLPDSQCPDAWRNKERAGRCGLGFELVLLLTPLLAWHRRRIRS
jgi:hypothetical protein